MVAQRLYYHSLEGMLCLSLLLVVLLCAMSQFGLFEVGQIKAHLHGATPIWEDRATSGEEAEEQVWPQTVGGSQRHFQRHLPMSVKH